MKKYKNNLIELMIKKTLNNSTDNENTEKHCYYYDYILLLYISIVLDSVNKKFLSSFVSTAEVSEITCWALQYFL